MRAAHGISAFDIASSSNSCDQRRMTGLDWKALRLRIGKELALLVTLQRSDRSWQLPFAAALASGGPMLFGAATGQAALGALGAIAGLAFLYLPPVGLFQRIPVMMACAFAMLSGYAVGLMAAMVPGAAIPLIWIVAVLAMLFCKAYSLAPPGPLFIVLSAAVAAFTPLDMAHAFRNIGYFAFGALWACGVAIVYSALTVRRQDVRPVLRPAADRDDVVTDALIAGFFVALSLLIALLLDLPRPYWVPVSCLAIMQGVTLRASWTRNVHRIVGTFIGLGVTWLLLPFIHDLWTIAAAIILLTFIIETVVVRHYAFAAIFFTPLTLILAEASHPATDGAAALMAARLIDTIVGAMIGLSGALCLHTPGWRLAIRRGLFRLGLLHDRPGGD